MVDVSPISSIGRRHDWILRPTPASSHWIAHSQVGAHPGLVYMYRVHTPRYTSYGYATEYKKYLE